MKAPKTRFKRVLNFFKDLLGIKPSNGIKKLKKKCGIVSCFERNENSVTYLTDDLGFIIIEHSDVEAPFAQKSSQITIEKIGGTKGLNGVPLDKFNAVKKYSRQYSITDRPYVDYSGEKPNKVVAPHIEVWDSTYYSGNFTLNCEHRPLHSSAYKRYGFSSGNMKV